MRKNTGLATRVGAILLTSCGAMLPAAGVTPTAAWLYPAIAHHGGVHPRETLPFRPEPSQEYRIIVDVASTDKDPAKVANSLDRLARLVNLMAYAGVPPAHTHIVAVLDEGAGLLALTNAVYRTRFKVNNPNLPLLHQLKTYGVQLLVCSQAMAEAGFPDDAVTPDVTISLSALTDFAVFGREGYSYMRL
ncbi:MAG TPA: DsrE family protein [Steroidobacteraceae bacterium]|nr:DsrE family protein [Steroidobacteraceae bacterium]